VISFFILLAKKKKIKEKARKTNLKEYSILFFNKKKIIIKK